MIGRFRFASPAAMSSPSHLRVHAVASLSEGIRRALSAAPKVVGLFCTLVVLSVPFGCSPVPFSPGAQSPYARLVTPEDLYIEETDSQGPLKIEPGDSIEVVVRRGAGEERSTVTVRDNGRVFLGSLDIDLKNLTVPEAETHITEQVATIVRNPRVEVSIKQKKLQLRKQRVFLLGGGTGQPGTGAFLATGSAKMAELDRKTTVGQLLAQVGFNDYAVLDDIRVIRGDARKSEVIPVDLQRFFQYGDRSQDVVLKDNDIVFVPRQRIGDWNAFLAKINQTLILLLGTQTLAPEALTRFLQDNNIQPVQVPSISVTTPR
jgi:protein involved in polysaccharide export with SLBB domain